MLERIRRDLQIRVGVLGGSDLRDLEDEGNLSDDNLGMRFCIPWLVLQSNRVDRDIYSVP